MEKNELISRLANKAHEQAYEIYLHRLANEFASDVIFYDIFNDIFAKAVVDECAKMCMSQADKKNLRTAFGIAVEPDVKYPAPEVHGSITSQYTREYNIPRDNK